MRRAGPYRGENHGPGKDVQGELDLTPGIREQPGSKGDLSPPVWHVRSAPLSDSFTAAHSFPPAWCPSQEPALSHAPHWSRESRLSRCHLVRPNDHLFAVLPLDRHCFMSSLIPALIDCEVAKDRLCLKRKQCFPQLFGVETAGLPYRVYQKLASGISSRRLDRRRMVELFLIGHNELLVSRIRKRGVPE